ncbi:E3 ubiquitin protein ligase RIN2-like isoform X2 [Nymphaea colorata]|uniref:E3 ubiquitin protein ligase RIN2-like isoform X2 n=1 Tax=Nymphaea colorata TaxID=210225 RepID=UPI00129EE969|nr:E3 ubiquitin protein ligase RIN2-like isoform X2 [Nymphaea colorata]
MGGNSLTITVGYTVISLIALSWRTYSVLNEVISDVSVAGDGDLLAGQAARLLSLLLDSYVTVALLVNLILSVFVTAILCLKTIFFGRLSPVETTKTFEHLINYVIQKGAFIPLVIHPDFFQAIFWMAWFMVISSLKLFEGLAKERLERLNASPSTTPWIYSRVYLVLLSVLFSDILWIRLCVMVYRASESSSCLLLLFEPLGIAFETMQAIMVHGLQLVDTYNRCSMDRNEGCHGNRLFDGSGLGSLWEWKDMLIRNFGFVLDVMTLLMAMGHYMHIWWLHGLSFHLIDAVLFLNLRTLLAALIKRVKGFIKLRVALNALQGALPDASTDEILAYNDECAICKEPMATAKKLSCNHLFHLSCLRAWLDQGMNEAYSCPTCRRPLVMGNHEQSMNDQARQVADDEQLARRLSSGIDQSASGHDLIGGGTVPNQPQGPGNSIWRTGLDAGWVNSWPNVSLDGAGPSTPVISSVGFGRVQMMMRHLAAVGGTYAHDTLDDTSWSLWPMAQTQMPSGAPLPPSGTRYSGSVDGLRLRNPSSSRTENISSLLSMADTVREVLPHIPDEMIFQDLRRTNSVALTVENLLHL